MMKLLVSGAEGRPVTCGVVLGGRVFCTTRRAADQSSLIYISAISNF